MTKIGENIRKRREELGMSQEQLALKMGYTSRSTINKIEKGTNDISQSKVVVLADILRTTPAYLMGWEDEKIDGLDAYPVDELVPLQIAASVRAGFGGMAEIDYEDELEYLPKSMLKGYPKEELLVVRVVGDSMYPKICDGDKVLVHLQTSVDSGTIAVVVYNGEEATIKTVRYVYGEDWMELIPANPEFKPKRVEGRDLKQCHVVGKVIKLLRDFE